MKNKKSISASFHLDGDEAKGYIDEK